MIIVCCWGRNQSRADLEDTVPTLMASPCTGLAAGRNNLHPPPQVFSAVPGSDDPTASFFVLAVVRIECHKDQQVLNLVSGGS